MKFLLGYNMKIVTWWEGTNFWCGGKNLMGEVYWGTFPSGGMSKFLACEGGIPSTPPQYRKHCCPPKNVLKILNPPFDYVPSEVGENLSSPKAR